MSKPRIVSAIELGSSKVATLIAQIQTDPITFETSINVVGVSSVESRGIKKGQIVDIEEAVDATVASVEAAERMAGYNLESAYISIGGANISSQNSHGVVAVSHPEGEITAEDVNRVVEAASAVSLQASREVVHVLPREFIVDGENGVKDPAGMSGVRLETETHLVTASAAAMKNIRKAINEVGVSIDGLIFSGIAASEACVSSTEKELGCCLVDIGGGTTSIAAFIDGALCFSSVIPVGAKNVTNDLAIGLRVSLESAEKIKIALSNDSRAKKKQMEAESANDQIELKSLGVDEVKNVSRKTLTEGIIRPRLNEIFTMVKIELERGGIANRIPSGVIITGGGAQTVGVLDSAKRMMSLPARIGTPRAVKGLIDDIMNPSFSVLIGLILYGAKQEPQESSKNFSKKIKFPSVGGFGKIIDAIKDLLP